jgi:hypothetical protein
VTRGSRPERHNGASTDGQSARPHAHVSTEDGVQQTHCMSVGAPQSLPSDVRVQVDPRETREVVRDRLGIRPVGLMTSISS